MHMRLRRAVKMAVKMARVGDCRLTSSVRHSAIWGWHILDGLAHEERQQREQVPRGQLCPHRTY